MRLLFAFALFAAYVSPTKHITVKSALGDVIQHRQASCNDCATLENAELCKHIKIVHLGMGTECPYCQDDFLVLNRHRCPARYIKKNQGKKSLAKKAPAQTQDTADTMVLPWSHIGPVIASSALSSQTQNLPCVCGMCRIVGDNCLLNMLKASE